MLNTNKYLDGAGVATLWQRIQRLVYECAGKSAVTYRLESDGNTITLIGSDGTSSSVAVISTASCGGQPTPSTQMSVASRLNGSGDGVTMTTNVTITVDEPISNGNIVLEREAIDGTFHTVQTWTQQALTGTTVLTATETLYCSPDSSERIDRKMRATLTVASETIATAESTYEYDCSR